MKREALHERLELLEIGECLGYPRLGYGRSSKIPHDRRIPPGKDGWEKFAAHAHVNRIMPALRIGRVLRDNGVQVFHPMSGREMDKALDKTEGAIAPANTDGADPLADILDDIPTPAPPREEWVAPGTLAVYPPGKRRRYPSKKNKRKVIVS